MIFAIINLTVVFAAVWQDKLVDENALTYQPCMTAAFGFDFFRQAADAIFNGYLVRFNAQYDRLPKEERFQKRSNFRQNVFAGNLKFKVGRMQEFGDDLDVEIDWEASIPGELVAVNIPFKIYPTTNAYNSLKEYIVEAEFEGRLQLHFKLTNQTIELNGQTVTVPQFELGVDPSAQFKIEH